MNKKYDINSLVIMKKPHACKTNLWRVTRNGVDIKLECVNCKRSIMMGRIEFEKKLKKVVEE